MTNAKGQVYSDFVLCLGKMSHISETNTRWSGQVEDFKMFYSMAELLGIDGEAIEFEWNIFQGSQHCKFFRRSRTTGRRRTSNPSTSPIESSSCRYSMTSNGQREISMKHVFRMTGHPVFTSASALSRGSMRRSKGKETTHTSTRILQTQNSYFICLSISGAVSNWRY